MESARKFTYGEITLGDVHEYEYAIAPVVYQSFLAAFDDRSPIHVDPEHAKSRSFGGPVMHGGILNGFLSHFVGMVFPGAYSLLLGADLRYLQPSYLGDVIRLQATVAQKLDAHSVVVMNVKLFNTTRDCAVASGRVQVKVDLP